MQLANLLPKQPTKPPNNKLHNHSNRLPLLVKTKTPLTKPIIEKYVADNGLKGKYTDSGIFYVIEKEGKGANPTVDNFVEVHYKGTLLDGNKFDSSYDRNQPAQFPLRGVVPGWQQGIPLFKEGGKGTIIIPSSLAYGPMGRPPVIPQNAVLRFDIELLKVMAAPAQK